MNLIWAESAANDLSDIVNYLFDVGHPNDFIENTVSHILEVTHKLKVFPNIGRIGSRKGTRELVMPDIPYIIVYRVNISVEILRVVHTSRYWNGEL